MTPEQYEPRPGASDRGRGPPRLSGLSGAGCDARTPSISTTCCCTWPRCCARIPRCARISTSGTAIILVDEYQDTNLAQYAIARALSIDHPNLAVTGDPGPVDLRLAGGQLAQHPGIREGLSPGAGGPAGAELPQHEADSAGGRRLDPPQRAAQAKGPVHRKRRRPAGAAGHLSPRNSDEADAIAAEIAAEIRAGRRRPRDFAIFYRINALSRAFEFAPARPGRALPDGQRPGVLPAQGNQGRPGLSATAQQSARRRGLAARHQHARPRHRQNGRRAARRPRRGSTG